MKNNFVISFIAISLITAAASEDCDKCVLKEKCLEFGKLSRDEQDEWQIKFPCEEAKQKESGKMFGFGPTAKGDYVCCSNGIWGRTGSAEPTDPASSQVPSVNSRRGNYNNNFGNRNNYDDQNGGYYPNSRSANGYDFENNGRPNNNGWGSDQYPNNGGYNNGYDSNDGGYGYTQRPPKNYFNSNNNPYVTSSPFFPVNRPGNNGNVNQGGQCAVTSFPPQPETGCCGREASDADRIIGGKETELEQFPWTVLLKVTFDYGDKRQAFNCGGSLISSRYVLTAGHCVYDEGGKIVDIEVNLAEYDKRTFPKDCKLVLGQGQKCIENVVMKADDVTLHPQYQDAQLKNDIALIRLRGIAPYTDYIRPICLPSIDIDSPNFSNLRLAVAGWGRNGRYRSDIKQSTIVNLVPQEKCKKFYPGLSRRNLCAAGYTGEDTCKGDSGGPLMTVYGGKYEVVGVVSGKRADSPCGTSVPSLYTNVYHYRDWIRNNIKN
ncbi:phenoloxidase-activating enzyme-like isoform X2 [Anticarsia gemmatalis]|uniref:phenoloxidase-activating enzyme-like isoform X2 n=1 Tax=Anticarsia gemmatalis TaxID=129554 RepID=UPI003F7603F5